MISICCTTRRTFPLSDMTSQAPLILISAVYTAHTHAYEPGATASFIFLTPATNPGSSTSQTIPISGNSPLSKYLLNLSLIHADGCPSVPCYHRQQPSPKIRAQQIKLKKEREKDSLQIHYSSTVDFPPNVAVAFSAALRLVTGSCSALTKRIGVRVFPPNVPANLSFGWIFQAVHG